MMIQKDVEIRAKLCRHLNISEGIFFALTFDVYSFQAAEYRAELPQYLQHIAHKVLGRSTAFRNWFNAEKAKNDGHILQFLQFFEQSGLRFTTNQYVEFQKFYFEKSKVYPPTAVIELAVKDWKNKVELI